MQTKTVYGVLNTNARRWWHHAELRAKGKVSEAREAERRLIRSEVKALRQCKANGGWFSVGRGGWTLHIADGHRMEGYGDITSPMIQAAIMLGIPGWDSTVVADNMIVQCIRFPLVKLNNPESPPYTSFSYAPLSYVAGLYAMLGATMYGF